LAAVSLKPFKLFKKSFRHNC